MSSTWVPRYLLPDGTEVDPDDVGRLWQIPGGGWVHPAPAECPGGHPLRHPNVLVGNQPCIVTPHRTHTCLTCDYVVYTPPITKACTHEGAPDH